MDDRIQNPIRVGVIGAGNWGRNIVRNLSELGALAGVADSSPELRAGLREQYPAVPVFDDVANIVECDEINAVAIATPAPTHFGIAMRTLELGKDVFVEKPMTLKHSEACQLAEQAEKRERILMVGHLLLYQPAIQWIKQRLEEEFLGKVFSLHQQRLKLGRARYVENVTWSLGVHDLAVLLYLVDEDPVSVFASGHCGLQEEVEDDVYVHLTFRSGTKAHLHNSWLWPENRRGLTIVGERGMLVYDEVNQRVIHHRKTIDAGLLNQDFGEEIVFTGSGQPLEIELRHFLECCEKRSRPISDGRNGARVISVLERIGESQPDHLVATGK